MTRNAKTGYVIIGLMALTALLSIIVWADNDYPYGMREVNYIQSSRSNVSAYPPAFIEAEAGNVTELSLVGISTTKGWQGYYGNISGTITLEDINGFVFYNWTSLEPKGEIFASTNDSISWGNIVCFDFAGTGNNGIDVETEEARYGFGDDSADGINETFTNLGLDSDLFVGSVNITDVSTGNCHTTNPYQLGFENSNTDNFENFLLTDQAGALVFGTIIENDDFNNATDVIGYNGNEYDFQLLVAENGFNGFEDTTTTYYFWAEIE